MFIGEYSYIIDHKKRVAIPSKFRKALGKKAIVTKGIDKCLTVYTLNEWEKVAKKLGDLPSSRVNVRGFVRVMLSGAVDITLDKLGRILIPDYLKEYAGLEKEVVVVGLSNKIEIWNNVDWKSYKDKTEKEIGDMAQELGI